MSYEQERRTASMRRVPVQALVEICGRDAGGAPAFEAESLDVSGRGMHLRTAYLPEVGSPLVCRFENGGNEIVVEGTVAWRNELERGGEFGIQFTALDSGSVEALKRMCGLDLPTEEPDAATPPPREGEAPRVRLHIDGLGSPMKASIRAGGTSKVQVASNLDFLMVGRNLEIENAGERRGASIDGVDVVIDPKTRVPQLVVALRYDGAPEATPEPSVIDSENEAGASEAVAPGLAAAGGATTDDIDGFGDADLGKAEDELMQEAQAMRGKIANMAVEAGSAAKKGGAALGALGARAASGLGRFFKGAGTKMMELRKQRQAGAPKRTTAPAPGGAMSAQRKLRPQSGVVDAEPNEPVVDPAAKKKRMRKIAALSALGVLLLSVGVIALKKPASPPGASGKEAPAAVAVATAPTRDVTSVDEQGNPAGAKGDQGGKSDRGDKSAGGANADVPLFGPTPMATMEPAPLGPAPGADEGDSKKDDGASDEDEESKEKKAASAAVDDQLFGDDKADGDESGSKGDGAPWGNGKMHDPIVHRLHLDKAGKSIQGAVTATGFTVVIPGVKVMESPKAIMDRDSRIAHVKTKNGTSGAEINFQFKDGIPGYRVRLKKDYVEFLISSPSKGGGAEKQASSTGGKSHAKKHHKKSAQAATDNGAKKQSAGKKHAVKGGKKKGKK